MLVVYCPTCGTAIPVEEYNNPRMRMCMICGTVWEILERPKPAWVEMAKEKEYNE